MTKMPISGLKSVEFIEEATFGTTPGPNGDWSGFGILVDKYDPSIKKNTEAFRYLPTVGETSGLTKKRTQIVGGELGASLSGKIQDFSFWKYAMGNASTLSDTLTPISIAEMVEQTDDTKRYLVASGNIVESIKLSLPEEGIGSIDVSLMQAGIADPSDTDPAGTGDHASEDTSDALMWSDISDLCMDATTVPTTPVGHIIGDLNVEIANDIDMPKDIDETTWTKIAGHVLKSRDINVSIRLTWVDINDAALPKIHDIIKNSTKQNLRFTLGDRIVIVKGLLFTEWNPAISPEEYIGQELSPETDNPDFILAYKMGYAYADDGASFTDETTAANNTTENDMTLLPAAPVIDDAYYFGRADEKFSTLQLNIGTAGVETTDPWTILWEYWSGGAWATCMDIVDGTTNFTAAAGWHDVTHTVQAGWAKTTVNSVEAYWIRARLSAFTDITTQPKGTQCWVYGE